MNETVNVFVYGTLMFPEVTSNLRLFPADADSGAANSDANSGAKSGCALERRKATLIGFRRYCVKLRSIGNFPAIVPGDGDVHGQILLNVSADSLSRMDEFEGTADGYYSREPVSVSVAGESMAAFAYVCGDRLRAYLDGHWDPAAFRENELQWYVRNVVG